MDNELLDKSPIGQLVPIEGNDIRHGEFACFAYLPSPLPSGVDLANSTWTEVTRASSALARLDQATKGLQDPKLLIYPALFREALDTSALEGTYGQLSELLEAKLPGASISSRETKEITAYLEASENAFRAVETRPITLALLCDIQREVFKNSDRQPRDVGSVRTHQVWIGENDLQPIQEARFVPPPGDDRLRAGIENLIEWIGSTNDLPPPLRTAMAHYQFETLHPFGDGNGRVGRLTVILQLLKEGSIDEPAITISPWLLRNRRQYQDQLLRLSETGDWNPWVIFFSHAIIHQCDLLVQGAEKLDNWYANSIEAINSHGWSGKIHEVLKSLAAWPSLTVSSTAEKFHVTSAAATNIVKHLCEVEILTEVTGRNYGRVFDAREVIAIVDSI